jgi:hypothetical protein
MFYRRRFDRALRDLCTLRSESMVCAAQGLPIPLDQLARSLTSHNHAKWQRQGLSPRQAAIAAMASIIEKDLHRERPGESALWTFLTTALMVAAVRDTSDAALVTQLLPKIFLG